MPAGRAVSAIIWPASIEPPNPVSAAWNLISRLSRPAFFRWYLALSGSYPRCGSSSVVARYTLAGPMGLSFPSSPYPRATTLSHCSRSTMYFIAVRTSLLSKGAILVSIGSVTCLLPLVAPTTMPDCRLSRSAVFAETLFIASSSPVRKAFSRAAESAICRVSISSKKRRFGFQ